MKEKLAAESAEEGINEAGKRLEREAQMKIEVCLQNKLLLVNTERSRYYLFLCGPFQMTYAKPPTLSLSLLQYPDMYYCISLPPNS